VQEYFIGFALNLEEEELIMIHTHAICYDYFINNFLSFTHKE